MTDVVVTLYFQSVLDNNYKQDFILTITSNLAYILTTRALASRTGSADILCSTNLFRATIRGVCAVVCKKEIRLYHCNETCLYGSVLKFM